MHHPLDGALPNALSFRTELLLKNPLDFAPPTFSPFRKAG